MGTVGEGRVETGELWGGPWGIGTGTPVAVPTLTRLQRGRIIPLPLSSLRPEGSHVVVIGECGHQKVSLESKGISKFEFPVSPPTQ